MNRIIMAHQAHIYPIGYFLHSDDKMAVNLGRFGADFVGVPLKAPLRDTPRSGTGGKRNRAGTGQRKSVNRTAGRRAFDCARRPSFVKVLQLFVLLLYIHRTNSYEI